jgi:hypothetical protein
MGQTILLDILQELLFVCFQRFSGQVNLLSSSVKNFFNLGRDATSVNSASSSLQKIN